MTAPFAATANVTVNAGLPLFNAVRVCPSGEILAVKFGLELISAHASNAFIVAAVNSTSRDVAAPVSIPKLTLSEPLTVNAGALGLLPRGKSASSTVGAGLALINAGPSSKKVKRLPIFTC